MKNVRRSSYPVVVPEQKLVRAYKPGESPQDLKKALQEVRCAPAGPEFDAAVIRAQEIANRHAINPYVPIAPANYPGDDASAADLFTYWQNRALFCKTSAEYTEIKVKIDLYFDKMLHE